MKLPVPHNPIRAAALVCVAIITGYLMYMAYWMTEVLAGQGWCAKAIGADRAAADSTSKIDIAASCVGLLTIQLRSLATNSHILFGMFALSLLVLIVIVIAGGRLNFAVSKTGASGSIGKDEVDEAVQVVADEAQEAADKVKAGAAVPKAKPDEPGIPDYAKP